MTSLVLQLQQQALDHALPVTHVLRTALVVATKLGLDEMRQWCETELKGYQGDVPEYRRVRGEIKAFNPYRGWIPVMFKDAEMGDALRTRAAVQPVSELEHLVREGKQDGRLQMPFSQKALQDVFGESEMYHLGMVPTVFIDQASIIGILDAVRTAIVNWTLRLEKEGVLGEGLAFSQREKERAAAVTYNIGQFSGVLGNVVSSQLTIGDYSSIHAELQRAGVSREERHELEEMMDTLPAATPAEKPSLLRRGTEWLLRNGPAIGALSDSLRGWFEMHAK